MKALKIILTIFLCLAAILALLVGGLTYVTRYKITDIDASASPNGEYELLFQNVGEPDWPFGYSHARFVLKQGDKTITKYRFDVANDGGTLWADNWDVSWEADCARVIISGEEQPDILYTLYFDGTVRGNSLDEHGTSFAEIDSLDKQVTDFSASVQENENGESVFAVSVEAFIDSYNKMYQKNHGVNYLPSLGEDNWRSCSERSPRFGYNAVRYKFSEDETVWSMPTISIYAPDNDEMYEIRMTFDDHGYQEELYNKFKESCCCLLNMVCQNLSCEEIDELFCKLYELADSNFFGNHNAYGDPERPPLSAVYQYENVGFYCYYGAGTVEICMIPLTARAIEIMQAENTVFHSLKA